MRVVPPALGPSFRRVAALAGHEVTLLAHEPGPLVVLIGIPIVVMLPLGSAIDAASASAMPVSGAQHVVAGQATMFAFFLVNYLGAAFFRDHGWRTWDRLRASELGSGEIVVGKVLPFLALGGIQMATLFAAGTLMLDLDLRGRFVPVAVVGAALVVCVVGYGVALVSATRSLPELTAIGSLGAIVMGTWSGALVPIETLPGWAQVAARGLPSYWAMRGFRALLVDGAAATAILVPVSVLLGFAALFLGVARARFRIDEPKRSRA